MIEAKFQRLNTHVFGARQHDWTNSHYSFIRYCWIKKQKDVAVKLPSLRLIYEDNKIAPITPAINSIVQVVLEVRKKYNIYTKINTQNYKWKNLVSS